MTNLIIFSTYHVGMVKSKINFEWITVARETYSNWAVTLILLVLGIRSYKIFLRENDKQFFWTRHQVLNHLVAKKFQFAGNGLKIYPQENKIEFPYLDKILVFYGYQQNGWIYNEINKFEYDKLQFKGKFVIDVGANSGATAIYFAMNGAKKVVAIEPMPKTYEYLVRNVKENKLESAIEHVNVAVWKEEKNQTLEVNFDDVGLGARVGGITRGTFTKSVPIMNLGTMINDLKESDIVIKMDCEGCEYVSLLNIRPDTLSKISEIMMEYHNGWHHIFSFLEQNNFAVELLPGSQKLRGMIYAKNRIYGTF